jgi:RHH-type transcriptional regulator, rel operon repressor / antitoxin RelB
MPPLRRPGGIAALLAREAACRHARRDFYLASQCQMLYVYSICPTEAAPMLALRLPPEIEARLAELAKRTGRTKSFYAREAILNHLDDLEDLYLAENRLNDLREGRSGTIPLNDLLRRHGVED